MPGISLPAVNISNADFCFSIDLGAARHGARQSAELRSLAAMITFTLSSSVQKSLIVSFADVLREDNRADITGILLCGHRLRQLAERCSAVLWY